MVVANVVSIIQKIEPLRIPVNYGWVSLCLVLEEGNKKYRQYYQTKRRKFQPTLESIVSKEVGWEFLKPWIILSRRFFLLFNRSLDERDTREIQFVSRMISNLGSFLKEEGRQQSASCPDDKGGGGTVEGALLCQSWRSFCADSAASAVQCSMFLARFLLSF